MNKQESLALYAHGKEAWNAWAEDMLARRQALQDAGKWSPREDAGAWTTETRDWHTAAAADFAQTNFGADADLADFVFPGAAKFDNATFPGDARFHRATFSGGAVFYGAAFSGDAEFDDATFTGGARFNHAKFAGNAEFTNATFAGDADFDSATFTDRAGFFEATFAGMAEFSDAAFSGLAWFGISTFSGDAKFDSTIFAGTASFDDATFDRGAIFRAIKSERAFSIADAHFHQVPDFIQATFAAPPRLDDCRIEPRRNSPTSLAAVKAIFSADPELSARWRALKKLAIEAHDHDRELAFFKGELQSRRWTADPPWRPMFWFGLFYEWLSDYGRSVFRPLAWWAVAIALFAGLYVGETPTLAGAGESGIAWTLGELAPAHFAASPTPLTCEAGAGAPLWAAVDLSVRNALIFAGTASSAKMNQNYACLYGIDTAPPPDPRTAGAAPTAMRLATALRVNIPYRVALYTVLQSVISAVLLFLFLLAVRNHFRIK